MIDELSQVREAGGDIRVVAGRGSRVGVGHRVCELLQRPIVDRERLKVGKHSAEHSRIVLAGSRAERFPRRVTAGRAVTGSAICVLCHSLLLE